MIKENIKPVVLVTAIGTVTSTSIVGELRKTGKYYIIGADINHAYEIATSLDVDEFCQFPSAAADPAAYLAFALEFCRTRHVAYYYAVIDKEVVNIADHRADFEKIGTKLCVPDAAFNNLCHFKNSFVDWITANVPQIAIRTFTDYTAIQDKDFPLFIKPNEGVASNGCRKLENRVEMDAAIRPDQVGTEYVVQEYVEGEILTVDMVRNRRTGQSVVIPRRELLRNGNGCGIAVQIVHDEALEQICAELMQKMDLNGVAIAEFFVFGGQYRIIEINPRFSAGTRYSCMAGINTVLNAMRIADGQECVFGPIAYGKHFAERYETYQMD